MGRSLAVRPVWGDVILLKTLRRSMAYGVGALTPRVALPLCAVPVCRIQRGDIVVLRK